MKNALELLEQEASIPAFPTSFGVKDGMSLRDWFAGMAVTGLLASMDRTKGLDLSVVVHEAFRVADSMRERRKK